jgi:hypothetical protein
MMPTDARPAALLCVCGLALGLLGVGCQRKAQDSTAARAPAAAAPAAAQGAPSPAATPTIAPPGAWRASPLGRDLERICNVLSYTGTENRSSGDQLNAILAWLPANIESEGGTDFLASIAELQGNAKADALDAGARKVGLAECALAQVWRQ